MPLKCKTLRGLCGGGCGGEDRRILICRFECVPCNWNYCVLKTNVSDSLTCLNFKFTICFNELVLALNFYSFLGLRNFHIHFIFTRESSLFKEWVHNFLYKFRCFLQNNNSSALFLYNLSEKLWFIVTCEGLPFFLFQFVSIGYWPQCRALVESVT